MTAATPATARPKAKPSAVWIVVAIVLMVIGPGGCSVALATTFFGIVDDVDEFGRFSLPAEDVPVSFPEDVDDGSIYVAVPSGAPAPFVRVGLYDEAGGEVFLSRPDGEFTVEHPDASAVELFEFSVDEGTYTLQAIDEQEVFGAEIWLGRSPTADAAVIGIALALGGALFLVGLVVLVIVLIRRRRSRAAQAPTGWPPPPAGWPPPPPGSPVPPPSPGQYPGPYTGVNPGIAPGLDPGLYPGLDPGLYPGLDPVLSPYPPPAAPPPPPAAEPPADQPPADPPPAEPGPEDEGPPPAPWAPPPA